MIAPTAAVTIGMLTVNFHYQTVCTCDVTKALGPRVQIVVRIGG